MMKNNYAGWLVAVFGGILGILVAMLIAQHLPVICILVALCGSIEVAVNAENARNGGHIFKNDHWKLFKEAFFAGMIAFVQTAILYFYVFVIMPIPAWLEYRKMKRNSHNKNEKP